MKKCIMIVSGIVLVCCTVISGGGCTSTHYVPTELKGTIPPPITLQNTAKKEIIPQAMIRKASIVFSAYEIKTVNQGCEKVIQDNFGLIESSDSSGDRLITMTVRVPCSAFDKVLSELEKCGNVDSKNVEVEDVSDRVMDLSAELKSKIALRDRFRELLKKANDVKDAICVEENLARMQTNIDRLQARLNNLNQRVEYSEINIKIEKNTVYGPLGYVFKGIFWGIEKLFVISR